MLIFPSLHALIVTAAYQVVLKVFIVVFLAVGFIRGIRGSGRKRRVPRGPGRR